MDMLKKAEGQGQKAAKSVKYAAWEMKKLLIYFRQNPPLAAKVYIDYICGICTVYIIYYVCMQVVAL